MVDCQSNGVGGREARNIALPHGRPRSFPDMVRMIERGAPSYVAQGDFLDEFRHADKSEWPAFVAEAPCRSEAPEVDEVFYAHCAATAEKLAHDFGFSAPSWVEDARFFLEEPNVGGYRIELVPARLAQSMREQSPREFARRNLFVTDNVLTRY